MSDLAVKQAALVTEAAKWIGVHENGGNNHGPEVEMFQKAVGGKAQGEAWCMAFAQFCVRRVDAAAPGTPPTWLYESESCLVTFNKTPLTARIQGLDVVPGDLIVWQHFKNGAPSYEGHVGIIAKVSSPGHFETIEGNTSDGSGINRDGDGVFRRVRDIGGSGTMRVKGFLRPWQG